MAYCGTVTVHDENGEALHTIRYGAMPDGDVIGLRDRLVNDVVTLLSKRCEMKLQLLCDGAPELWNLLEEGFAEDRFGGEVRQHTWDRAVAQSARCSFLIMYFLK